ncbi:hypothetical protein ACHAW6_002348 [Cyclotella cf. meneghiniana]
MAKQKYAIVGCALFLASTAPIGHAFSAQALLSRRDHHELSPVLRGGCCVLMMSYMDEMNRRPPAPGMGGGMGIPPPPPPGVMGGRPQSPPPRDMGRGPPPPGRGEGGPRSPHLDRHASDYLDELRAKRSGNPGGNAVPTDINQGRSYSANNPPGAFSVPNAGNTSGQPRRGPDGRAGLGALASGVSTPMDKYNFEGPRSQRERGSYRGGPAGGPNQPMNPRYNERGGYGDYENFGPVRGDGPVRGPPRGPMPIMPPGPDPRDMDIRQLQDEVERLRTENAMLKRSAKDLMNNFNELSNRLFDVDESLKKVANVFPSEDEMESLEWLLKK